MNYVVGAGGLFTSFSGRALHVLQPLRDQQQVGILLPALARGARLLVRAAVAAGGRARALGRRADALVVGGGGVDGGAGGVGHRSTQIRAKRPEI